MQIPTIAGVIDRRILVNFRIDADAMSRQLPAPFEPVLAGGYAIGGICLIRLRGVRPAALPLPRGVGICSENAAHRIAVRWPVAGGWREGVYIPRRDTDSMLNALAGGRIFPGEHHHARFTVDEDGERFSVEMASDDGSAQVSVVGRRGERLPAGSVFADLDAVSRFFEAGALGYSETRTSGRYDGLELRCIGWAVEALDVESVSSSYFEDPSRFPPGSVTLDNALLMRDIDHEWHSREALCCG